MLRRLLTLLAVFCVVAGPARATTLNPSDKAANAVLSNGNLTITTTTTPYSAARSTTAKTSGKVYFEVKIDALGGFSGGAFGWGIGSATASLTNVVGDPASSFNSVGYSKPIASFLFSGSSNTQDLGTLGVGAYVGVALDLTNKNIFFVGPSGVWDGVVGDDPVTNTGGMNGPTFYGPTTGLGMTLTTLLSGSIYAMAAVYDNAQVTVNFGASSFNYAIPAGFTAWDAAAASACTTAALGAGPC